MSCGTRLGLALLHVHQAVYERSDGRIGHRLFGVRCLLLRTTGRRSGRRRTTALAYARDGDAHVVVGSLGGADVGPAWLHNVRALPGVEVQVGRRRFPATALVVEQGEADHARLWTLVNAESGGRYDRYQAKTSRPIPVVVLLKVVSDAIHRIGREEWWAAVHDALEQMTDDDRAAHHADVEALGGTVGDGLRGD